MPAGDLVLVDAVQEARPRFLPDFVAPWVVWNHIVLRLGDSPDGRCSPHQFAIVPMQHYKALRELSAQKITNA